MIILLVLLSVINFQILTAMEPNSPEAGIAIQRALLMVSVVGVACIFVGILLYLRLPASINRPIRELTDGILEIANHNYEKRLNLSANKEFVRVSESFNSMAERLAEYRASSLADILQGKKYLEAIVNAITEPIIGLDNDKLILFINNEALSILNMKRENVIRKSATDLALKNDLMRRLIREMITPDDKNEPLKIYADNKESFFQAKYIPIRMLETGETESQSIGHRRQQQFGEKSLFLVLQFFGKGRQVLQKIAVVKRNWRAAPWAVCNATPVWGWLNCRSSGWVRGSSIRRALRRMARARRSSSTPSPTTMRSSAECHPTSPRCPAMERRPTTSIGSDERSTASSKPSSRACRRTATA